MCLFSFNRWIVEVRVNKNSLLKIDIFKFSIDFVPKVFLKKSSNGIRKVKFSDL